LLPGSLLAYSLQGERAIPHFLTARDEVWIRRLLGEAVAYEGRTVGEWDSACEDDWTWRAVEMGATPRGAAGALRVIGDAWATRVDAQANPSLVRRVVFEAACRRGGRDAAIRHGATLLNIGESAIEACLFADRAHLRRLVPPPRWFSEREVCELYNLRLVQGLLLRARDVALHVGSHVRAVVRYAKLKRLLCVYELTPRGTALRISGPLSILRHTTKYGHALASFLPAAVATPGWSLEASCELRDRVATLALSAKDPIACVHALPREADSEVERRLVRDVRKLGTPWQIERETAALPVVGLDGKERLFFPDFTLVRGSDRVLVEIVGFYTPEYLASKLRALRQVTTPVIVCVDESLGVANAIEAAAVLRYRGRVDASGLLAAAEEVVRRA